MNDINGKEGADPVRRGVTLAALGISIAAPAWVAAAEPASLQVAYSTDPYLTCDALVEEMARMDAIVAAEGMPAAIIRTARERKKRIGGMLQAKKGCAPAAAKTFGPDMYDLPGTAPGKR